MKTTLDEIQTFIAIVDSGSITKASEQLGQTLSGVSRTLRRLEKKLGVSIFRRTTRKLDLTEEGELFLEQAREIVNKVEIAEEFLAAKSKDPSGLIRIDSASPFVLHAIVPIIEEFKTLYPLIRFEIHSNDRIIDLLEKRVDVAIRIGKLEDSTLRATHLGSSRIRILASPDYLKKYGTPKSISDLANHHLLGFTVLKGLNQWPLKDGYYADKLYASASSGETLLQLARSGVGIACLSDFMTSEARESGELVQLLKTQTIEVRQEINAVYYKDINPSKRTSLFVQFLKKHLKNRLA